jgi:hypothetical protein
MWEAEWTRFRPVESLFHLGWCSSPRRGCRSCCWIIDHSGFDVLSLLIAHQSLLSRRRIGRSSRVILLFLHVDRLTRIDNPGGLGYYAFVDIPNLLAHKADYSRFKT